MAESKENTKNERKFEGSETIDAMRSWINLNPYNPKRHTDEQVKQQVKNIRRNGYLGGIVWNRTTKNLVDGHRRIQALDIINHYDGTPEKDYCVKVEAVVMDAKTEKEQMTFMAVGNSKADYNLIAEYIGEIDYKEIGISDKEFEYITSLLDETMSDDESSQSAPVTDIGMDLFTPIKKSQPMGIEEGKAVKKALNDRKKDADYSKQMYIMLRFDSFAQMTEFCDSFGMIAKNDMIVDGMEFLERIS